MDLNQLPNEVLEHVFCHIPCQDLMRTMRIVCRRWNDIIVRRRFQPWKKSYFRYKVGENGRGLMIGESDDDDEPPKKKNKKKEPSLQLDLDWKIEELKKAMSNVANVWNEKINADQYLHPAKTEKGDADVNFRLEIAAPWLVKFMSEEFSQFEKEGNFLGVLQSLVVIILLSVSQLLLAAQNRQNSELSTTFGKKRPPNAQRFIPLGCLGYAACTDSADVIIITN